MILALTVSGPAATVILSRYAVALHPVKMLAPTFSAHKGGVALQVASWKVSQ